MQASLVITQNIFKHDAYVLTAIRRRRRISTLAPDTQKPFICLHNGNALLRKDWKTTIVKDGDVVAFIICPPQGGGGGSNPLMMILTIGIMLAAPGLGLAAASQLGLESATVFGISASTILGGVIAIAGKALVGSMFGTPSAGSASNMASMATPSPTYTIAAQGNTSRIGDPIPAFYGTNKIFPNYAAEPYGEFAGNEQYLYQLFCVGQGYCDIDAINILDTPITSFPEITYEVIQPGGTVTLFPANVISSGEVVGQEAIAVTLGPYVACLPGTIANALSIDIVCPRGIYYANDQGGLDSRSIVFLIEAQQINDSGGAVGAWVTLGNPTITAATNTPQRFSYRYAVAQARYQVRLTRTSAKDLDSRVGNDLNWGGLRAYLPGSQQYGNVTIVAMRMRASNSLTAQSSRKVNMIVTRKLPIWNGVAWSAPTRTRSIAWAIADICRAPYGAGYADSRLDLAQLLALDTVWAARGDTFNGIYDSAQTFWESLTLAAKSGRAKPYRQGGIIHIVRDAPRSLPVAMFNMRNITKGSVQVQYLMPTEDTADVIELKFWDESIWNWNYVNCALPGSTSLVPAKVTIFGVTSYNQAYREGMYLAAVNKYRRTLVSLGSEMEGFIPSFGDLCAVSHDRPMWGQSGEVLAYDSVTHTVTLSESLDFSEIGTHYFSFRYRDGSVGSPFAATPGTSVNQAILATPLDFVPDLGYDRERTLYTFGVATTMYKRVLLAGVKPRDLEHCDLTFMLDDDRVYTADSGAPTTPTSGSVLPVVITRPAVTGLTVTPGNSNRIAIAAWLPSAGADKYAVEISYDIGVSWSRIGETTSTRMQFDVLPGTIEIRVAAIGLTQGTWAVWTGNVFSNTPALPDVTNFVLAQPFVGKSAKLQWSPTPGADNYTIFIYSTGVTPTLRRTTANITANSFEYTYEDAKADGGPWRNLIFKIKANSATSASANLVSLSATNPQISAPLGLSATAAPQSITVSANKPTDSDWTGTLIYGSTTTGFTPSSGNLLFDGQDNSHVFNGVAAGIPMYYRVAFYDNYGADSLNFSSEISAIPLALGGVVTVVDASTITATPGSPPPGGSSFEVVYSTTSGSIWSWQAAAGHYVNNADLSNGYYNLVSASKAAFGSLSALSANLGNITAGTINGVTGTFSGNLAAAGGTFSGALSAASGTFNGTLLAGVLDLTSALGVSTIYTNDTNADVNYTLTVPAGKTSMRITLRAGSGGGGGGFINGTGAGGAGGGGGVGNVTTTLSGLTAGAAYSLTVGKKGLAGTFGAVNVWGGSGTAGTATVVAGILASYPGQGGGNGIPASNGGSGINGGTAGTNGGNGGNGQWEHINDYVDANGDFWQLPSFGGSGGTGFSPGGQGGDSNGPGSNGVGGYAIIEFFNPNSVVLMTQYSALKAALTSQGISTGAG